jgi:hypothetical protein
MTHLHPTHAAQLAASAVAEPIIAARAMVFAESSAGIAPAPPAKIAPLRLPNKGKIKAG